MDLRKQGAVHAQRFWRGLEVPSSDFLVKLVRFGDVDADALQFGDFVVLLWLLAAIRDKALVDVCVELYDTDSDGLVTLTEVQRMVRDLHGDAVAADERVSSLLANLDKAANGLFDEAAVKKMVEEKGVRSAGSSTFPLRCHVCSQCVLQNTRRKLSSTPTSCSPSPNAFRCCCNRCCLPKIAPRL